MLHVPATGAEPFAEYQRLMDRKVNPDYIRNLALATIAGQSGCMTVILVFLGLFGGMYLDARLDTRPAFTIGLALAAVPISLYAMVRLMLSSMATLTSLGESRVVSSNPAEKRVESSQKENRP